MRNLFLGALVAIVGYTGGGVLTYGATVASTQSACVAPPSFAGHVAVWPISFALSYDLRSMC